MVTTETNRSVLLVEDHDDLAATVGDFLQGHGYVVDFARDGLSAMHLAVDQPFDAIVLDINLPGVDGFEVCRRLRRDARQKTPIIMLTARAHLEDKLTGFDVGADDYLVKPFELAELAVRIDALIRRERGDVSETTYRVGELELDTERHIAMREGRRLTLSPRSFQILKLLLQRSPAVVPRSEIEHVLWGEEVPDSDSLRSHMYNLRRIVDKPFSTPMIRTVSGAGFQLVDPSAAPEEAG